MAQTELVKIDTYLNDWHAPKFNGLADEDVRFWLGEIREGLEEREVPRTQWVRVAFHFLGDGVRAVLARVQQMMSEMESTKEGKEGVAWDWDWETFARALIHIHDQVKKKASQGDSTLNKVGDALYRLRQQPAVPAAAGIGLITLGGITVGPAILVGTLNLLGFSSSGVVGDSIAAGIQSAVYGGYVTSGSAFAMAQAAVAGGIFVSSVPVQAVSAGAMAIGAWIGLGRGKNRPSNDDADEHDPPILLKDERTGNV
ncbi:hypothetical protein B0H19DRAFT_1374228 [Mycena capillaripes]|nr:hypothetical protein B0H19DRAFT_1374228 [Mycena capillaripes]